MIPLRDTVIANSAAISIIGTTQIDLISSYLNRAANEHNDGLLQRFQLFVFPDPIKDIYTDSSPNQKERDKVSQITHFFNRDDLACFSGEFVKKGGREYACLSFDPEAQKIFQEWYEENGRKIDKHSEGSKSMLAQHLAKYRKLLPALCGIFHLVQYSEDTKAISTDTIKRTIALCCFLESHAIRIYGLLDPEGRCNSLALELIEKIKQKFMSEGESPFLLKNSPKEILLANSLHTEANSLVRLLTH